MRTSRFKLEKNILRAPTLPPQSSAWMQLTELCLFTPIWFSTVHAQVSVNINYFYQSLQCAEWLVKRVYCKGQMKTRGQGQMAVGFFFFFIIENLGEKQVITRPTGKLAILSTILCLETNTDLFRCSAWQGLNFLLMRKHPSGMKCSQGLSKEMRCNIPSLGYFGRAPQCCRISFVPL